MDGRAHTSLNTYGRIFPIPDFYQNFTNNFNIISDASRACIAELRLFCQYLGQVIGQCEATLHSFQCSKIRLLLTIILIVGATMINIIYRDTVLKQKIGQRVKMQFFPHFYIKNTEPV